MIWCLFTRKFVLELAMLVLLFSFYTILLSYDYNNKWAIKVVLINVCHQFRAVFLRWCSLLTFY